MTPTAARTAPPGAPPQHPTPQPRTPRDTRRTRLLIVTALLATTALAVVASLALGSKALPPSAVLAALSGGPSGATTGAAGAEPSETAVIVWQLRVPRTALGLLAGAALGVAGALMQGHTRNPLADPGLLGVTQGAGLAVVVASVVLGADGALPPALTVAAALVGAAVGALVVVGVAAAGSRGRGLDDPLTLVLAGAAVTALFASLVQGVVLADATALQTYRFWAVGSLAGTGDVVALAAPVALVGLVVGLAGARALDLLALGDDVARGTGLRVGPARALGVVAIVLLVGAATAACGPVAFVGLVVPHVARALVGPVHRWLLPVSALVGAALVLVCDVVGRLVAVPAEVPVGVVLAVLGGPAFVVLVRRRRMAAL